MNLHNPIKDLITDIFSIYYYYYYYYYCCYPFQALRDYQQMWTHYFRGVKSDPPPPLRSLLHSSPISLPQILALTYYSYKRSGTLTQLCSASIIITMITQLYPLSPSYNTYIAFASLYVMTIIHSLRSSFLLIYLALMFLSIIMDVNWLIQMALMGFMVSSSSSSSN